MKLPKIKTLETTIWRLCKEIIRIKYPNVCFTCNKENLEGKDWHTGHFIKKRKLPYELKYDLRILRPQCSACNLRGNGNEALYAINLIKTEGVEYVLEIDSDYTYYKSLDELSVPAKREFLMYKIEIYKSLKQRLLDIE